MTSLFCGKALNGTNTTELQGSLEKAVKELNTSVASLQYTQRR